MQTRESFLSSFNVYNTTLLFSLRIHTVGTRGNNWRFILVINIEKSFAYPHTKVFFHENFLVASSLFSVYSSLKFLILKMTWQCSRKHDMARKLCKFFIFSFFHSLKFFLTMRFFLCALLCVRGAKSFSFLCYIKGAVAFTHTHIYTNSTTGERNIYKWKIVSSTTTKNNNISSTDSYGVDWSVKHGSS